MFMSKSKSFGGFFVFGGFTGGMFPGGGVPSEVPFPEPFGGVLLAPGFIKILGFKTVVAAAPKFINGDASGNDAPGRLNHGDFGAVPGSGLGWGPGCGVGRGGAGSGVLGGEGSGGLGAGGTGEGLPGR